MAKSTIRTAPGALPLLGHLVPMIRDPLAFMRTLPSYGDLVQIRFGPARVVLVCDPGLTRQVLTDDRTYDKGGPPIDRLTDVIGDGLDCGAGGANAVHGVAVADLAIGVVQGVLKSQPIGIAGQADQVDLGGVRRIK